MLFLFASILVPIFLPIVFRFRALFFLITPVSCEAFQHGNTAGFCPQHPDTPIRWPPCAEIPNAQWLRQQIQQINTEARRRSRARAPVGKVGVWGRVKRVLKYPSEIDYCVILCI